MSNSYDPRCQELAEYFLDTESSEADIVSLAQCIQRAIEDWLSDHEEEE